MIRDAEDIARFITETYGAEYVYKFKKSDGFTDFEVKINPNTKTRKLENCNKCSKLIVSLIDKKSYYLEGNCNNCSLMETK